MWEWDWRVTRYSECLRKWDSIRPHWPWPLISTFNLWPPESNHFIFEWMFIQNSWRNGMDGKPQKHNLVTAVTSFSMLWNYILKLCVNQFLLAFSNTFYKIKIKHNCLFLRKEKQDTRHRGILQMLFEKLCILHERSVVIKPCNYSIHFILHLLPHWIFL